MSSPVPDPSTETTAPTRGRRRRSAAKSSRGVIKRSEVRRQKSRSLAPIRRERLTPVERLRRKAVVSDAEMTFGHHGRSARPKNDAEGDRDDYGTPLHGTGSFRLVCWNIEDGLDVDGAIAGLRDHPNLRRADAVCLQEMDPDGVDKMARELGLNYVYLESSRDDRTMRGFGNAVLSPWPLERCTTAPLPHVAKAYGRPRAAVGAIIQAGVDGMTIAVWSVHAEIPSLSLSRRVAQFTAVAAKATAANPDHLIVAGDFNTTTILSLDALDDLYALFDFDRLTEPAGPSLRRAGRLFRLDHIFGRGVEVTGVGIESDVIASDHWPLWVDVTRP